MGLKTCTPPVLPQAAATAATAAASTNWGVDGSRSQQGQGCPFLRNSRCPFLRNSAFLGGEPWVQQFHSRLSLDKLEISSSASTSTSTSAGGVRAASHGSAAELPFGHRVKPASGAALEQLRLAGPDRYANAKSVTMVVGLSFRTAPVELREKLAVPEAEWPRAIAELCGHNHLEEAAVLSTCNRMEIYVVALSWHRGLVEVLEWMSKKSGVPSAELREHLFILRDRDAYQHLFKVSSGLDSLVLGEGQILSQVKQVLKTGEGAAGFGRTLTGLFKQAVTAGKRVRSETSIASGAVSVSSAAVELAILKQSRDWFQSAQVLVVGAGKMARLLVKHLVAKGCTRMVVVNRSEHRVAEMQADFPDAQLRFRPLPELMRCAGDADLIFTCTAAAAPLFLKEDVDRLPAAPGGTTRCFVDIAVPRNVDAGAAAGGAPATTAVYNVDHLGDVVAGNMEERRREAREAQAVVEQEVQAFERWREALESSVPTIKKLRAYAERVRAAETQKCLSRLSEDVSGRDKRLVEELSRGIVNKLLHGPMQHLRGGNGGSSDGGGRPVAETLDNVRAVERMFDLAADFAAIQNQLVLRAQQMESGGNSQ